MARRSLSGLMSAHDAAAALWRTMLLVCCLSVVGGAADALAWRMTPAPSSTPHIDEALQSYSQVAKVKPSRLGAEDFRNVIRARVQCYELVTIPLERKKPCNISYVEAIIHAARKNIKSVPQMGQFVREVQYCPIMFNMCIGEMNQQDYCVDYERRCIDKTLDKFWRGSPENVIRE